MQKHIRFLMIFTVIGSISTTYLAGITSCNFAFAQQERYEMIIERYIPYNPDGLNFRAMDIDPDSQLVFYPDHDNDALFIIDLEHNVTKRIDLGTYPSRLAANPMTDKVYITHDCNCPAGLTVTVVDHSNGIEAAAIRTIENFSESSSRIALNKLTNKVYVISQSGNITIIDGFTDTVVGRIDGLSAGALDFNQKANTVYVLAANNTIYQIDGSTDKVMSRTQINEFPITEYNVIRNALVDIAVNHNTNFVYLINRPVLPVVSDTGGMQIPLQYLVAFNGSSNVVTKYSLVEMNGFTYDIAVNPNDNRVYALSGYAAFAVDGLTNKVIYTNYWRSDENMQELVIDPNTNKIYLRGQTGIFVVTDSGSAIPEFGSAMYVGIVGIACVLVMLARSKKLMTGEYFGR